MKKPVALIIMDGFGSNPDRKGNAIAEANTPNLDRIFSECPTTQISASGLDVGLPDGQMGNSEVGHTNIGAGRVVYQMLVKISKSIKEGTIRKNAAIAGAMEESVRTGKPLHLIGLLSDGGVHSHIDHLIGLIAMAKEMGVKDVYVHALLDGRDVPPTSGADYMQQLVDAMKEIGLGKVASIMGRFYAMDRDFAWDRVEKAYAAMVYGEGADGGDCPVAAIRKSYEEGVTDEFMVPTVITKGATVSEGDSVIFFNFRPDRARQITRCFVDPAFDGFERKKGFFPLHYVCMTQYDATMPNVEVAFPPEALSMTMGEYISKNGLTQLRIAETQKYAHVTFFYNGGEEKTFEGEDRILVKSPDVETFDMKPEMSAYEVTDKVVEAIESDKYNMIILNYANCDMVGHTGIEPAAIKAVEAVDACVARTVDAILKAGGVALITADHGNAEKMLEADGVSPFTAHTTNPVPLSVVGYPCKLRAGGRLADLSPTMLDIMGLEKPAEMDGESLIEH